MEDQRSWADEERKRRGEQLFLSWEGRVFALRINPGWGRAWDIPVLSGTDPCRAARRAFSVRAVAVPWGIWSFLIPAWEQDLPWWGGGCCWAVAVLLR